MSAGPATAIIALVMFVISGRRDDVCFRQNRCPPNAHRCYQHQ